MKNISYFEKCVAVIASIKNFRKVLGTEGYLITLYT